MQIQTQERLVEILAADYQITGTLQIRGNPAVFLNDQTVLTFTITDATFTPLMAGTHVGAVTVKKVYIPKSVAQVILLDMTPEEAQMLVTRVQAVCFTESYVVRGGFSTGPETKNPDLFTASDGPFFPASEAEVFGVRPLMQEIGGETALLYVHKDAVKVFYCESDQSE